MKPTPDTKRTLADRASAPDKFGDEYPMTTHRRLVLAVQDAELRARLTRLLEGERVDVELLDAAEGPMGEAGGADMVVLRGDSWPEERLAAALRRNRPDDAPGIIVLDDDVSARQEAGLVAAGASAVLDQERSPEALGEMLVGLTDAEADGGLQGPESGGVAAEPQLADFQSRSAAMREFLDMVRRIANTDSTLLITGETGVGKERLARAIHRESERGNGPFVAVNCGALPEQLLESELFGHTRGAFTGADRERKGHFEAASGGTLFLDEIAEIPLHLQVKLLTVLQRHEVQPVGAQESRKVDVRILAATNRDLQEAVAAGDFREDLFFRLNVVALRIPPLRERLEDLPWLVGRFIRHFAQVHQRPEVQGVEDAAMQQLLGYAWPGNVRELVNSVERAVLLCQGTDLRLSDLPDAVAGASEGRAGSDPGPAGTRSGAAEMEWLELPLGDARRRIQEAFERRYLDHHLREARGQVGEVARRAGINPRTLYEKMRRLGLRKEDYR